MIGTTLAHYRITAALGAGGMGEVWRATDEKLGREVALKVLSEEFASDPHRLERFEREARAVASLNHPHIVTIHSVEEADGVRFLTMELIEGRGLEKLIPEGGLELGLFLELAKPLAEAISAAHDKSVIHRDLKPANVMVDGDGRLKVLDFGLAKLHDAGEPSDSTELPTEALTGIGVVVGTMPYMSPEQIEGEIVDHRTDIFSLGILLYEMAIGERPFQGKSSPALMSSILKDAPKPVVELRSDLPRHLGRIIGRCLEKKRRDRYQTARDVFNELKALQRESSTGTVTPTLRRSEDLRASEARPFSDARGTADPSSSAGTIPHGEGFWVAVLPFKFTGGDADVTALAEGVTEEIVTGLSRFSYLRVIASDSEARDARFVIEGSLRKAGAKLRLAVQLVDLTTGAHLWAETYERGFDPESAFELQDDLVPRIVATVGDAHGILPHTMSELLRDRAPDGLTPYEAVLRAFGQGFRRTSEEHATVRACLERAVEEAPRSSDAWALLALTYVDEQTHGYNQRPNSLDRALEAARRAVDEAPSNAMAFHALAWTMFFRKERQAFQTAAEKSIALNPLNSPTLAGLGALTAYAGDWERGSALVERAVELNPRHPGWYWFPLFYKAYREGDYRGAVNVALKINLPAFFVTHEALAAAHGQLGERDSAEKALSEMLRLKPDFHSTGRERLEKWFDPELVEHMMDGLRKAGLELGPATESASPSAEVTNLATPDSGAFRAGEGFWVAVLPFKTTASDADLISLAEGMTEDIVTGLSRFSYLRVIARDSAATGARYLMEGSLRQAGRKLRVAVQLIDTVSGAHLWAETYDRDFVPDDLFALQDDLVPRVVSTCADHFGVLARAISEEVRVKPVAEMTPYEALMRGFGYHFRLTPEEHAEARDALEQAVEQAPSSADCWAMLAWVYAHEFAHDFNPRPDSLDRALEAARRAVDIAPSNHVAQQVLGVVLFFRQEIAGCRRAAERSMELNPLDGSNEAFFLITFTGEWERGCALIRQGMELNPHHPGWYRAPLGVNEYRKENYQAAIGEAVKANVADVFWIHLILAAAHSQLGEFESARKALEELLKQKPDFARSGRRLLGKWFEAELVEHLFVGLRKAGLEIQPGQTPGDPVVVTAPSNESDHFDDSHSADAVSLSARHTVGRQSEFDDLGAALEAGREGRGSIVCVAGEPGIGKTTLVEGFLGNAVADGRCTVARGRCSERLAGSDAYLPVLEALDSLMRGSEGAAVARAMRKVAPAWYAQIAPLSGDSDESKRLLEEIKDVTQERLKREFVACLREVSGPCPLIVFFDDLHWADVSTVDLLSFLGGTIEGMNVLVVVTYRPSDMLLSNHPFLQIKPDLQARGLCRELLLEFLRENEVADYLALEFPSHRFPREFPALIHAKTEGSPLFMADLVRYLQENGSIGEVDGQWTLEHGLPEIQRELPESVRGMIERKIGQLPEDDHKLLTAASVQGYVFDSAVVAQVLDLPADDVEERLDKLDRVHAFVKLTDETELPDHTLTIRYRFVHVLYQNALYASLRATRKATLSREFGQVLARVHGENTPGVAHELAALFEAGRDFARAAEYYLLAAGQASRVFADREAETLAAHGITMVERLDPSPNRAQRELELQLALGQALRTTKGYGHPDTGKVYSRARELCHDIGEAPQLFPVLFGLWEFLQNQGELESAVEVGEQMLALAETVDESGLLVAAHAAMADNLLCMGDSAAARDHAAQAIALYDPDKHQFLASMFGYDSGVAAHCMTALALWLGGYPDQAVESSNAAYDLANSLTHPSTLAFSTFFASWIHSWTGELEVARQMADRSVEIATEFEQPAHRALGQLCQGWTVIAQGEAKAGTALAREGVEGLQASGFTWAHTFCLGVVAEGCTAAGRTDEALALLEEALDHAGRTGERFHEAELIRLKGECLLRAETLTEPVDGERCFLQAIEAAERQQAKSWELRATTSLARLWQEQGRHAEAHERLERVYSWFTEGFDTSDLRAAKALLEELAAEMGGKGTDEPSIPPIATTQQVSAETKSIVVLPFANLSPDPDTEFFSDGLTDEIITDLSGVRALRVISRSSAMRLKGDERGLSAIGRDLNCEYVLEGSVRRDANTLRMTARLVDAPNDVQLWADKYRGTLDDVFDIQERVSRSIVDALEIRLTPQEAEQLAERPIDHVRAQESYLRARNEIWSFMPGGLDLAISHLEAALELIGDNTLIYQGLGEAYFQYVNIGAAIGREEELIGKAEDCVDKIFALEPESPRGYLVRAQTQMARGDIHGSVRSLRRVLQVFPNEIVALQLYTHALGWLGGKPEAAAPVAARLVDIDPLNPMSLLVSSMVPLFAGRFPEAVESARRMFELDPVTPVWRANYVMALSYARQLDEAEALTEAVAAQPDSDVGTWWMGLSRAAWREDRAEVLRLADGPYQQAAAWDAEIPWVLASAHAAVGATEEALLWLDRAIDQGMINYPFLSEHDRYLDSIRGDERFAKAMERVKREWERFDEVQP